MSETSEKNAGIRNLIEAHSWLGVIISVALFIVFWAGSIVLFHPELVTWSQAPHYQVDSPAEDIPIRQIVERKLQEHRLNNEEHLTVLMAGEDRPFHHVYIDLEPEKGYEGPEQVAELVVDPKTGETLADIGDFYLADFLLQLHYDLRLPGGLYLVGLATLIFLVLILTGIIIHARKLFNNFFLYREKSRRNRLLDMHNVIGVTSLPFGLMFAITGLVFNLSIIYQLAFAVFLYDSDQNALLEDAGLTIIEEKPGGKALDMTRAFDHVAEVERQHGEPVEMLRFYNYGDENAVVQIRARDPDGFAQRYEQFYHVGDGSLISQTDAQNNNAVRRGLDVMSGLHFGHFAGVDLRILYFLLGMGVAGMILVGNLLWLDKRALQKNVGPRGIGLVANLTLGGCGGVVLATAAAFLAERLMPLGLEARGDWLARIFAIGLGLSGVLAFVVANKRQFLRLSLWITAALSVMTVIADWALFGGEFGQHWPTMIGVETGLLVVAGLSLWIAGVLRRGMEQPSTPVTIVAEPS
ncbi:PepSY-associated TM helix domain-containing protein [Microbulbifer halophilus]|uniref:PepSY-associated TM helix domain-containing protein n=1 Tax=Microbulbifer halophilus TaxID=453963 RepID=A0ABW5E945_9GAMM|nr:PepSY-associated TM helix domain-containing protein [Microbulbifer halophilus]MCW8125410.1 PepSY-associated TM helix domain-containing protein [Microbulbifer halophilus]